MPFPKQSSAPPPRDYSPHIIKPDGPEHRYPLRSLSQQANALQSIDNLLSDATCNLVVDENAGATLEYRHLLCTPAIALWTSALANNLGKLAQGVSTRVKGTNTICFTPLSDVPQGKKVTYPRIAASLRPHKMVKYRVRVTVGGDKLEYTGNASTQTASLTTTKCLTNSTLSTKNARFMSANVEDYYYGTEIPTFEYMCIPLRDIPDEIIV